jgi:hypothetical protein
MERAGGIPSSAKVISAGTIKTRAAQQSRLNIGRQRLDNKNNKDEFIGSAYQNNSADKKPRTGEEGIFQASI